MSKPFTEEDLARQLDDDRVWRIKEISDLRTAAERADKALQQVLLRSLITIAYAHWEGSVKFAAGKYMEHVALRKFQYDKLNPQFLRNFFLPRLNSLSNSRTSIKERCELIDSIFSASSLKYSRVNSDLINTKSNLNFSTFSDICLVCGVPTIEFEEHEVFIDVILLKRRNSIAHGEDTLIGVEDLQAVTLTTIALMRAFGTALENQAVQRAYAA